MQITLETDYAARCLVYLKNHNNQLSVLGDIAADTLIPPAFLSKILQRLIKHGLVKSRKGKKGGFRLAKSPERITMSDIVLASCGSPTVVRLVCSKNGTPCVFLKTCKIHGVWKELGKVVEVILESRMLSQL